MNEVDRALFRGRRLDNGEWLEGVPLKQFYHGTETLHICEGNYGGDIISEAIDPFSLCQWIGRCDKNGEKIWFGSTVKSPAGDVEDSVIVRSDDGGYELDPTYEPRDLFELLNRSRIIVTGSIN